MNSDNISYQAGQAKATTEEKASSMADKASCAAGAATETAKEAGAQMQAKAEGAVETIKDATGINKSA